MARTAEEHNLQASFTPTQEQISKFPSLWNNYLVNGYVC
jgi:hypothetical protein